MSIKLPAEQIERIVAGTELAPNGFRNLSYEGAIAYFQRLVATETAKVPEWAVVEVDVPVRDKKGAVVIDPDGYPRIERKKVSQRSAIAKPILEELAKHQNVYRAWLAKSNYEHIRESNPNYDFKANYPNGDPALLPAPVPR